MALSRQARLLVILGVIAVGGVGALALMAQQYAKRLRAPAKSVMELERATEPSFMTPTEPPAEAPAAGGAAAGETQTQTQTQTEVAVPAPGASADEPNARAATGQAPDAATPPAADDPRILAFLAGRQALVEVLDNHPYPRKLFERQVQDLPLEKEPPSRQFNTVLLALRMERAKAIQPFGLSEEDYRVVLAAYRAWRDDAAPPADPALASGFERHRDELQAIDAELGVLDALDVPAQSSSGERG